jgi:hypothetical protein
MGHAPRPRICYNNNQTKQLASILGQKRCRDAKSWLGNTTGQMSPDIKQNVLRLDNLPKKRNFEGGYFL